MEGVREKIITEENAGLIAPQSAGGGHVPPHGGVVENIVVDERRGVNHLDDGAEAVMRGSDVAAGMRGQKEQRRPEAFALVVGEVSEQAFDAGAWRLERLGEDAFDFFEVAVDWSEQ